MQSFLRPSRRAAIVGGAAGLALVGAVGIGTVAFADSAPTPGTTQSPAASGAPGPRTHAPHIGGTVLTVDGSTVTVQDRDGFTRTVRLASDATVTKDGAASSASAITKGAWIEASGTVDADRTSLDATEVRIGQPTGPRGHGRSGGHGGDRGSRPAGPEGAAPAAPGATPSGTPTAS